MDQLRVWSVYFSATGTTEKIVKKIGQYLSREEGCEGQMFDFTLPENRKKPLTFQPKDLVIFGTPVYAGRVPNVLLPYLNTLEGGGALAVPVVLFGNRDYDDGLIELRNILEDRGFHTIGGGAFVGEHSFSRILAAGRPDEQDLEKAETFARQIHQKISQAKKEGNFPESLIAQGPAPVKGQTPIRPYYQPRDRQGNPIDIRKVKPKTSEECIDCGLCAQVCPMGSIDKMDVRAWTGICIKCGSCIKKCPMGAKYYDDQGYLYHQHELELGYTRRAEPEWFL